MRVAGCTHTGGPVELLDVADPPLPGVGEVLIEVRAAGVGNWDDIVRSGEWDIGRTAPMALGVEAAGIVVAVGPDTPMWSAGDEVLTHPVPLINEGTWAPWLLAPTRLLARKPPTVSWAIAGALPVPALTAVEVIDEALHVQPGESVLVNGAGGVTGGLMVGLAALRGARVLATAGPASRDRAARAGAHAVVDYHDPDWVEQILEATAGAGVDVAANAARGAAQTVLRVIRDGGRLATITGDPPTQQRGISVTSVYVRADGPLVEPVVEALAAGQLEFSPGRSFPLNEAKAALEHAVAGGGGAVLLGAVQGPFSSAPTGIRA
jgi:NADPH:quinone reductase-like Zn-dependent oxidoreductase